MSETCPKCGEKLEFCGEPSLHYKCATKAYRDGSHVVRSRLCETLDQLTTVTAERDRLVNVCEEIATAKHVPTWGIGGYVGGETYATFAFRLQSMARDAINAAKENA